MQPFPLTILDGLLFRRGKSLIPTSATSICLFSTLGSASQIVTISLGLGCYFRSMVYIRCIFFTAGRWARLLGRLPVAAYRDGGFCLVGWWSLDHPPPRASNASPGVVGG